MCGKVSNVHANILIICTTYFVFISTYVYYLLPPWSLAWLLSNLSTRIATFSMNFLLFPPPSALSLAAPPTILCFFFESLLKSWVKKTTRREKIKVPEQNPCPSRCMWQVCAIVFVSSSFCPSADDFPQYIIIIIICQYTYALNVFREIVYIKYCNQFDIIVFKK